MAYKRKELRDRISSLDLDSFNGALVGEFDAALHEEIDSVLDPEEKEKYLYFTTEVEIDIDSY